MGAAGALRHHADGHCRGLCLPRAAHAAFLAQEQVAGQRLQVSVLDPQHLLGGLRAAGAAVGHAGAYLVPFHPLQVGMDAVPERSVPLPVLDLHLHHRLRLRSRPVLWLGLPVRLAAGRPARHRREDRSQALPVPAAHEMAQPAEVGEVRRVLRAAGRVAVLDGRGREAGRGGALQDHLPGGHHQPQLALWALRADHPGTGHLHRAAVLQVHLPAGRLAGHAQHVPLVRPQAQARLQQVQGLRQGLRFAGHQRRRPDRPPRVPALSGLPDPVHR